MDRQLLLKNLVFTLIVPGTVAVYIPLLIVRRVSALWRIDVASVVGLILVAVGAGLYLWCLREFAATGRGTPAPIDAPTRLVMRGPYQYVRNPMYVAVLVTIVGWSVAFLLPLLLVYAAAVAGVFHLFVIFYEEPALRQQFGEDYEEYVILVNRWTPWV